MSKKLYSALIGSVAISIGIAPNTNAQSILDGISEIVVTAQRREQRMQDVPISITALSGDQLAMRGITSTEQLDRVAAGVLISQYGSSSTITLINIRGVAQLDYADHQEAPNAVYLDGAYVSFQGAVGTAMFDMERVEILRGPQGTLFGRNATGGLIQLVSRKPTDELSGYVQALYGRYNRFNLEGAIGGALADNLKGRASFSFNRHDGYMKNTIGPDGGADETYNGRLQLLWSPSADIENLVTFYGSKTDSIPGGVYNTVATAPNPANHNMAEANKGALFAANCAALGYGPLPVGADNCLGYIKPDDGPYKVEADQPGIFDREIWGVTNTLTWNMGNTTLTSITNYTSIEKIYQEDNDSSPANVITYNSDQDAHQFSQELRLNGDLSDFRWTVGGYYLRISGDYGVNIDLTDSFGIPILGNSYTQKVETYSFFGQAEYDLNETLTVIGGFRWTKDKKSMVLTSACGLTNADCVAFGFAPTGQQFFGDFARDDWSGRLQLTWKPNDDVMLYGGVNRGNKGSLLLAPAPPGPDATFESFIVEPEILTAYEAGVKSNLFGRQALMNFNVFYYDYKNYQAYNFVDLASQIFSADAEFYGAELEFAANLGDSVFLNFGAAYLHTKVKDVSLPDGTFADQRSVQAPKISLNGSIRKDFHTNFGIVFAQAGVTYNGARYFSTVNEPVLRAPGYVTGDLALGIRSEDDKWNATFLISNINDKKYIVYLSNLASIAGYSVQSYAPPRQFSFQVRRNF